MAFERIVRRAPYFGRCFTTLHKERLVRRLEACVFSAFQNTEHKLFQPNLATLLREGQDDNGTANAGTGQRGAKRNAAGTRKVTMPTPPKPAPGRPDSSLSSSDNMTKVRDMAAKATLAEAAGGDAAAEGE